MTTVYKPLIQNPRFINYGLFIVLYFTLKQMLLNDKARMLYKILTVLFILSGLFQAVLGLLQLYGIQQSLHSGFKITGTFFNPALYALYLAAVFPFSLGIYLFSNISDMEAKVLPKELYLNVKFSITKALLKHSSGRKPKTLNFSLYSIIIRYLALVTVISIFLVLPATMNRASWLGVFTSGFILIIKKYELFKKAGIFLNNSLRKTGIAILAFVLIAMTGTGLFYLKKGSSLGRLLIWEVTLGKIAEKPIFGHGIGRFEAEYNNWQADYFQTHPGEMEGPKGMAAGNTKYCFNEYLEMASETGVTGLIIFLSIVGLACKQMFNRFNDPTLKNLNENLPPGAAMISILVCAMISIPFYSLPTFIVFFIMLAMISSQTKPKRFNYELKISSYSSRIINIGLILIFSSVSICLFRLTMKQYKALYIWDEAVMLYQIGSYKEACKSFSEVYNSLCYTGAYLQYYGKALNMNEDYEKSLILSNRAILYTSDEILYTTLGDTYKALQKYQEAEQKYLYASFMAPHKLYPMYLLVNLYCETGQNEKAIMVAEEVLQKKIKVESFATEEIKQKMKDLTRKLKNQ